MNTDDLFRQMEEDELRDGVEAAKQQPTLVTLTPIQYAKARNIRPQRVYMAFRNNKLTPNKCACGRTIVNVDEADTYFGFDKVPGDMYREE